MPPDGQGEPHTVLVIDDSATVRTEIVGILRAEGYRVLSAADGRAGLWKLWEAHPDLILCDLMMPEVDGFGVLEAIRGRPDWAMIPFICLTAHAERHLMRQAMERGADDFVGKPVTASELLAAVRAILEKQARIEQAVDARLGALRRSISLALPHEFRTPLTVLLGYSEMLLDSARGRGDEDEQSLAAGMVAAATRLHRLTENFLLYAQLELSARHESRQARLEVDEPIALDAVVAAQAQSRAQAYQRAADLACDTASAPVHLRRDLMEKVIGELIDNAFKFSQPGAAVIVRTRSENGYSVLTVTDHGLGMTEDEVATLGAYQQFERAFREQQGLGLGLGIVRRVAELCGGHFRVESQPDVGTTVSLVLPASRLGAAPQRPEIG